MNKNLELLDDLILTCPETGEQLEIAEVETNEDTGELLIYVQGPSTKWLHRIKTEEV